ncbi:MAG TPA: hypothetical protein VFU45_06375 [Gemmatimonadales bacterium]|nr:hypothetical protein [Gemmatimonadales bacterium]
MIGRRAFVVLAAAAAMAAACSHLSSGTSPVAIQLVLHQPYELEVGDTVQLNAYALDEAGDSVGAPIIWRAPDTTVTVDSLTGRATAAYPSSTGRIQARTGSLVSDVVTFSTYARSDTIVIDSTADTTTMQPTDSVSAALVASLQSFALGGGSFNRRLSYTISLPADSSVTLEGGHLAVTVSTLADGTPAAPVHLHKTAAPAPDSAVVVVSAARPSGTVVPGSGQRFVVHILH